MFSPETLDLDHAPQGRSRGKPYQNLLNEQLCCASQLWSIAFAPARCQAWFSISSQLREPQNHSSLLRMLRSCCLVAKVMKTFWARPCRGEFPFSVSPWHCVLHLLICAYHVTLRDWALPKDRGPSLCLAQCLVNIRHIKECTKLTNLFREKRHACIKWF